MMDNILIHGKTQGEHDEQLQKVLQRLQDARVTLNLEKCQIATKSVKFLDISLIAPELDRTKTR